MRISLTTAGRNHAQGHVTMGMDCILVDIHFAVDPSTR